ncbi:hypothetical protein QLX08_011330 [Tetragonisca angustula]|uniref:Uncharacterized protein n=1 Tax=Tetragonisca angustula TaxID=166442 RepID=A0AAW0Z943_9HYME
MMRIIETISIRLPVFVLLIATLVLRSGAYEGNDGNGGSLAYSSAYAAADVWQPFPGSGSLAGSHDGHKGIRSYDNAGSNRPNDEGNRRGAGCTKCKWEDDDYWEKGWEDEAGDEEDSDDCYDDGQYREHDHGHGRGGSPPAVQKLGAPSPSGASAVGSGGPPFRATPVKQGGPWDAKSPVFGQQPGPGWTTVAPGTSSRPTWNQGFDGGAAQPSGNSPNVGARPADVGGSKTGSECSGGYQRGTGCAQGAGGVGPVKQLPFVGFNPGNVQKQASSDYAGGSTAVYNPRGCSNSPYDTGCADKSVDGTRPGDSSVVPSYGPTVGQGQHSGSGSPQSSPFGSPYDSSASQGQHPGSGSPQSSPFGPSGQGQHPGSGSPKENSDYGTGPYRGFPGSTKSTVKPGNPPNFNAVANAVSSSVAYASTGPGVGHPASGPSTSTYSSGTLPGSPGSSGGSVPYGSRKPSRTNVKESLSGTAPKHDASKDGESKIFYIDVKPVPGSPLGVRPRTTTSAPYSVVKTTPVQQSTFYSPPGSTKPSYQPTPYSGPGATKPSYQTTPYGGPTTTKPSYQPAPYDGPGITKPSYQPSAYGGPGTTKPFYQPPPYDGPGITKPSYQPAPYDSSGTTKLFHQPTPYGGPGTTKISYQPTPYGDLGTTKPSYQPAPYNGPRTTKPFYQPASYDGPGVTKPSFQLTPYSGPSTVKPSYQPAPYGGPTTTKPFYQPVPHNGPGIKKPSYQPAPYSGPGTTEPSYQPAPYGGPSTVKPSYQPALYDGPGLTKPSYQPAPYSGTETTKSPYQFPSKDTNVGCTRGAEDCEAASGCSGGTNLNGSPDYKPCGQPGLPVAINKTSGPVGGFQAYPTDFAQNPQQNIPGASQPFDGFPVGVGSGSRDCTSGSSDCTSGSVRPAYVDNKIPGEGGSYSSNPFLNGKIPNLIGMTHGGQFAATTTSKPIGFGNPFLQPGNAGAFAGAAAWSNVGSATASNPAGKSVVSIGGETTKPVSRDNPFLGESGHGRGDIEIDNPPGGSASWSPGNDLTNTGLGQTNVNPFLGDKTQQGSVRPSDRYPGSSWSSGPIDDASSSATKSPSAAPRGSGSGGGVGIGLGGFASDKLGHDGGGSFPGAFSGAFSSSQSSSNSGAGATNPIFGQANDGSWASGGVNAASQAGSGAWSSSGASAYAASSASSWAGSQPSFVKG